MPVKGGKDQKASAKGRGPIDKTSRLANVRLRPLTLLHMSTHPHTGDFDKWCDDPRPHLLSPAEWAEVLSLPEVTNSWGLVAELAPEDFAKQVYAAKFHFHSGSPGYVGDLYIIQGDVLTGDSPLLLIRDKQGKMTPAYDA